MTAPTHGDPLIGKELDQRYLVQRRLARGGMSTVYLATDRKLHRPVALKVLYPHLAEDPTFVARFESEAITAARLSHSHVVGVFDQGEDGETVYLVLEYVPGITLRDVLRTQGRLSPRAALDLLGPLLGGLAAAHAAGLVHRDVKPENVLLSPDGRIKVADFGLARAATAHTSSGGLIGTAAYMSPELVTGKPADARADVYAVGVLLYEMLTGEQPFTGESTWNVAIQHVGNDVPAPSSKVAGLSDELDELVRWCTEQDPEDRPHDAGALLGELKHIARGLDDQALDLGQDPVPLASLVTATVALVDRVAPSPASPVSVGETGGSSDDAAATTPLGSADARLGTTPDVDPDAATRVLEGHGEDVAGFDSPDATLPLGSSGAASPSEEADATSVLHPGEELPGSSAQEGATTPLVDPTRVLQRPAPGTPVYAPPPVDGADRAAATAPSSPGLVPRVAAEDPVEEVVAPGRGGKRQAKAEAKAAAKAAQTPTTTLRRNGDAKRGWIWGIAVVIVAALVAVSAWFFGAGPGAEAVIPDLRGASPSEAVSQLQASGFKEPATVEVHDEEVRAGQVVGTDPPGGSSLRKFSSIQLLVSSGPELFAVPNLVGLGSDEAKNELESVSLARGKVTEKYDESMEKGLVVSQSQKAGAELRGGSTVNVTVSKGPAPVEIPELQGKSPEDAEALLKASGLEPRRLDDVFSDDVAEGGVASSEPRAGASVKRGSVVSFEVSKGPEMVAVPNVVGKKRANAVGILQDAGFQVSIKEGSFGVVFDLVATQTPRNGEAKKGSTIVIGVY